MNSDWVAQPTTWIFALTIVTQGAITWWRVGDLANRLNQLEETVRGLREWRAQAREQLRHAGMELGGDDEDDG